MSTEDRVIITKSRIIRDLTTLGVTPGQVVMLHASVKAVGWVVGGPDIILQALLDVLTPAGTLMMYVSWADGTYEMDSWPEDQQKAYLEECPAFDPATSRAVTKWSILTEHLRNWPGACRSGNPDASVAALGAKADWITKDHPLQYGYGPGSPFEKLVQSEGKVLLLGAPLNSVTLLHYSENIALIPNKKIVRYRVPLQRGDARLWAWIEEYDTGHGIVDWPENDYFTPIVRAYLDSGKGRTGKVGAATTYLLDASSLHEFAVGWMEKNLVTTSQEKR